MRTRSLAHIQPNHTIMFKAMIKPADRSKTAFFQDKIDNLNKPKGSLGRLESLALQMCLIQDTYTPSLHHPCHILFGGDHGIEREGVSFSPREVTWQQMINYTRGGGGVNMFCRQHGFELKIVDVGVDHDFDHAEYPQIIDRKIAYGTNDFLHGPAMNEAEWERALSAGAEQVDACFSEGCNIVSFGEMGIGNTSPSSILMHLLLDIPLDRCVGAGSGLAPEGIRHKYEVLKASVDNFMNRIHGSNACSSHDESACKAEAHNAISTDTPNAISTDAPSAISTGSPSYATLVSSYFCGFEMAAAIGGMLRAAEHRMAILVDGFIMTSCMLVASRIDANVADYAIFGHCGDEGGHKLMLDAMGASPLLHLGLRLGEGTGAICAYPIVQSAVNMINEMDNFSHANITKYF